MSHTITNLYCKRKHRSRAGRQAREKFDRKLDEVRVTCVDSKEPLSSITPESPTKTFNPQEFQIKVINHFDELSIFFFF